MSDFTPQQSQAINARGNVLVVAGAGTGKTHTLISRCLRLVTEERVPIENILMVTFTEAAAAEMRARLRKELQARQQAQPEDEHLTQQLALLDSARISTLHGFCHQLLREHFHVLGLDPQFGVLDEQQTRPLQREALDEILERHYAVIGSDAKDTPVQRLIRVFGRGSDIGIRKLVLKLHAFTQSLAAPDAWIADQERRFSDTAPVEWRKCYVEAVQSLRTGWLAELGKQRGITALDICFKELETLSIAPTPQEIGAALRAMLGADGESKNWPAKKKIISREPFKRLFDEVEFLAALAPEGDRDPLAEDWGFCREQMQALISIVREFGVVFAAKKRDLGGVDFSDLEQQALRLLRHKEGEATQVALEWQSRLDHVVVDEYQDINAAQDAILAALSRTGADANRFLVGDVKQSIYRFRLANPKIFQAYNRAWDSGASGTFPPDATLSDVVPDPQRDTMTRAPGAGCSLSLTENFRSRGAVLNFVNGLFGSLMREEVGGVGYEALEFGDQNNRSDLAAGTDDRKCVELHIVARANEGSSELEDDANEVKTPPPDLQAVEREARLAARRLRELMDAKHRVWDKELNRFRDVKWSDMAVLLRSPNGRAETYAMEFNRAGIPISAARDGFYSSLEVSDLLSLLKVLDNPLQDVPLVAVLHSPLVGLSLEELAAVRATGGRELFWTLLLKCQKPGAGCLESLVKKLGTFLAQYFRWRELVRQTSLSQTLESALAETHYEAMLLADERGVERVANVRRLLDLARQFDPYQRQGLFRFLKFIRLQEDEELDLQPATAPAGDSVRLMSVHKSKGLEFSVVVLASLGTQFNEQDLREPVLFNEHRGLCPKITPPGAEESYSGLTHWMARRAEQRELRGEELRLFYVATTRARDHLILIGTVNSKAAAVRWESTPGRHISTGEVLGARNHLNWLLQWLPCISTTQDWIGDCAGENQLLRWKIYDENDSVFGMPKTDVSSSKNDPAGSIPASSEIEALKSRLSWSYPYPGAVQRAAKTSVTVLRRQAEEESVQLFKARRSEFKVLKSPILPATISVADVGTAHHLFLEHFQTEGAVDEAALRVEAHRLQTAGVLTAEQVGVLNFTALHGFWDSEVGHTIRSRAALVKRELEFTARFATGELDELLGKEAESMSRSQAADDFVVVQGVVDLAVLLPGEIWLLDFKTDAVSGNAIQDKVDKYSIQLRLYARALSGIYGRPVTKCWLHFLAAGRTRDVDVS